MKTQFTFFQTFPETLLNIGSKTRKTFSKRSARFRQTFEQKRPERFLKRPERFKTSWAFSKKSWATPPRKRSRRFHYVFLAFPSAPAPFKNVPSVFSTFSIRFLLSKRQGTGKNVLNVSKTFPETLENQYLEQPTFPKRFRWGLEKYPLTEPTFPKRFFYVFAPFQKSPRKRRKNVFSVFVFLP